MRTGVRLGAFAAGVAALAAAAYAVGATVGPLAPATTAPAGATHEPATSAAGGPAAHDADQHSSPTPSAEVDMPAGLLVSQDGYTLDPLTPAPAPGVAAPFSFTVRGPDGDPVTDFTPTHDKPLHLIVVRRDLTAFQHVHPTMQDGTWSVPLTFPAAGSYRAYADMMPTGADDAMTLGADVEVGGSYDPQPLPAPSRTAQVDDYTLTLTGDLEPGRASRLTVTVTKDGRPVTDLEPYLAAYGHLVALRAGDLAYLHVHPDGEPGDGRTAPGPDVTFFAEVPSVGDYRLFLDFQHEGVVRTAAFTAVAEHDAQATAEAGTGTDGGHGHADAGSRH